MDWPSSVTPSFISSSTLRPFRPICMACWCFGNKVCSRSSCECNFSMRAADSVVAVRLSDGLEFCCSSSSVFATSGTDSGITYVGTTFATNWEDSRFVRALKAQFSCTVVPVVPFTRSSSSVLIWELRSIIRSAKASRAANNYIGGTLSSDSTSHLSFSSSRSFLQELIFIH